jgi:beta-galactosidase
MTPGSQSRQIELDGRSVIVNGRRELLLAGEIHYPHSTPAMWPEMLARSRDMGVNTIQTYTFWNLHERERGQFDFSDRLDLCRFIECIRDAGLHAVLRLGPYICAETNYGGFPGWLRDVPGIEMRTFNEPFMKEMGRWLDLLVEKIRPYLNGNGGPVIMIELENEYEALCRRNGENGIRYTNWWLDKARAWNLGVPVMCNQDSDIALNTIHAYLGAEDVDPFRKKYPGKPILWTENWPGWYSTWGYPLHTRKPEEEAFQNVKFYGKGGSGMSWYMWQAGTHFAREGMYLQTADYGFSCPLDEYGYPTTMGLHTAAFNRLLAADRDLLLEGDFPAEENPAALVFSRRFARGDRSMTFVWNDSFAEADVRKVVVDGVTLSLGSRTGAVVRDGQLVFQSDVIAKENQVVRKRVPVGRVELTGWRAEPLPGERSELPLVEADQPVEQLLLTEDKSDYCWYTNRVFLKKNASSGLGYLHVSRCGDLLHVFVDGKLAASSDLPLMEHRGIPDSPGFSQNIRLRMDAGPHEISILCCALGMIKHNLQVGWKDMTTEKKGLWGPVSWKGEEIRADKWRMQPFLSLEDTASFKSELKPSIPWNETVGEERIHHPLCWYRLSFARPAGSFDALAVDMAAMNKGMLWLNGRCLSRYWLVRATGEDFQTELDRTVAVGMGEPTQRYYHLPKEWLREENELVVFEELGGDPRDIVICQWQADQDFC